MKFNKIKLFCFTNIFLYFFNFCSNINAQCTPPLSKTKEVIIGAQDKILSYCQFEKHDTIVSVGAGTMWREAQISVITDSLYFILEDIDTTCMNGRTLEKLKTHYEKIKGTPFTNQFLFSVGTEKNMPNIRTNQADKVLIMNAFHHFSYPNEMLQDCHRVLKSNGKLIISEHCAKKSGQKIRSACNEPHTFLNSTDFIKQAEQNGFKVEKSEKWWNSMWVFMFTKI